MAPRKPPSALELGASALPSAETLSDIGTSRSLTVWHFSRHLGEMVMAMFLGMGLLGAALAVWSEPPAYDVPFGKYTWMVAFMSAPMAAWMRYRGHRWIDALAMVAAMVVPTYLVVLIAELGWGLATESLMMPTHVAMVAGMVAVMVWQRDRYTHGRQQ